MNTNKTQKIALGLGLLVLAGGGAGAFIYQQGWLGKSLTPQEASQIIPQEATLTGFINTDPQVWSKLAQFGTVDAQKIIGTNLDNFQKDLSKNSQISYKEDIEPWLGNVMWAVIPNSNPAPEDKPNLLLVIGIKNKLSANNLAKKLEKQSGYQIKTTEYQGITITEVTTPSNSSKFSFALLGSAIILSDEQKIIERAIDVQKGKPSYGQKPTVIEAMKQKLNQENPLTQVYFIPDFSPGAQSIFPAETLEQLKKIKSSVIGVGVIKQGLQLTVLTRTDGSLAQPWLKPLNNKSLSQLPEKTMVFVNSQPPSHFWDLFVAEAAKTPDSMKILTSIRQTSQQVSLDADKDIFKWMDGEFAISLVPSPPNMLGNLGLVLLWQTSDPTTAKNTLEKLTKIATQAAPITVQQNKTQGKDITQWQLSMGLGPQTLLSYTWLESNSLAIGLGIPMANIIDTTTQSKTSLSNNSTFQNLTSSLPKENLGYGFIDVEQLRPTIAPFLQNQSSSISPETMSFYESINGIAMTSSLPEPTLNQSDIIVGLKSPNQKK